MSVEFTKLDASAQDPLHETLLTFWNRNSPGNFRQEFLSRRYAQQADSQALLGMSSKECIGLTGTFLHPARNMDPQLRGPMVKTLRWIVAENAHRAGALHAEGVHCQSSCPTTSKALTSLGFHATACASVMVAFGDRAVPVGPVNVSFLRGNGGMIPALIAA